MISELPFFLQDGEKIIKEAPVVQYWGVTVLNVTSFSGGRISNSGFGLFGGTAVSRQKKVERSIRNTKLCHAFLTNRRLIFITSGKNIISGEEKKLGHIFSEIPIEIIEGVNKGKLINLSSIDLSVRAPNGEINLISLGFLKIEDGGMMGSLKHPIKNVINVFKSTREGECEEWMNLIKNYKNNSGKLEPQIDVDSPLKILKTRYARGEITKEEFEQMKKDLGYN